MLEILASLDYVMTFMKKTSADSSQTIADYCKLWKLDLPMTSLKLTIIDESAVQNLVCLYLQYL